MDPDACESDLLTWGSRKPQAWPGQAFPTSSGGLPETAFSFCFVLARSLLSPLCSVPLFLPTEPSTWQGSLTLWGPVSLFLGGATILRSPQAC